MGVRIGGSTKRNFGEKGPCLINIEMEDMLDRLNFGGGLFKFIPGNDQNLMDIKAWIRENLPLSAIIIHRVNNTSCFIKFRLEQDAMAFKLTWL